MRVLSTLLLFLIASCSTHDYAGKTVPLDKGSWSPSTEQVSEAFDGLHSATKQAAKDQGVSLEDWGEYKFQYYGVIFENHFKLIYINAFCEAGHNWKRSEVNVIDGYTCFFQAYYDPVKKEYTGIRFNGIGG